MKKIVTLLVTAFVFASSQAQYFTSGNLALFVAAGSLNNTTGSIVEVNTTTPGQAAINTFVIDGATLPNALRFSGSATSTGYLSLSNDRSLLLVNGANTNSTGVNTNTILPRGVAAFNQFGTFSLAATYNGSNGNQTRSATTLNNTNYYIADQGGLYTNGTSSASPTGNLRSIRSFGGIVYVSQASSTVSNIQVATVSAPSGGAVTGLPGLTNNAQLQDFYMISSGANGSSFDILYVISATSNTAGTLEKFSLVAGTWVSNGTYSTGAGGFGVCASAVSGGADLFFSTGLGALTNNSVIKIHDNGGYNAALAIAPSPVTLYTTTGGAIIKGVSFTPTLQVVAPTIQFSSNTQSVLENTGSVNLTVNMTTAANAFPVKAILTTSVYTTASGGGVDYSVSNDTITFPAGSNAPVNVPVSITNDALPENAEYVSFKISPLINATIGAGNFHILYIRDNDYTPPVPTNEVMLSLLTSFSNGAEGSNSSEIVTYDSASQRLVIANSVGAKIDIVDFSNPSAPVLINSVNIGSLGNVNSVAVRDGIIAVAFENLAPQSNGKILFCNMSGALISQVDVGAMPDMITFNHAGTKVYAACEGEPNASYSLDPEGTIAAVDISGGVATVTNANVTLINFHAYNGQETSLRAMGVRIFGNNGAASTSQDFEPEYITISEDDQTAWVSLQENNALAKIDLGTNTVTDILPLGTINYTAGANAMDMSDQTSQINIINAPVRGMFMPDAITHMNINGTNYIFTANEGDSREYTAPNNEVSRISGVSLDATAFPDQNILKSNIFLGRLNATTKTGDTDNDGDIDQLHVFGGRGFSVWSENGTLLYNSAGLLENIIANNPVFMPMFNASNTSGAVTQKNRSDDKGPEIEGVAVANIDGDNLLFASSERLGGVFIFNIDNPVVPRYVGYYNNRNMATNGPDRGAEGIIYIPASASPNGQDLLILANEVSSTLSIYQVNTCAAVSSVNIQVTPNDSICLGDTAALATSVSVNATVQWLDNNTALNGETSGILHVFQPGAYALAVSNAALACTDTTAEIQVAVLANPVASINASTNTICEGDSLTLNATGGTPAWNNGVSNNTSFHPTITDMYVVTVTGSNGCTGMDSILITVHTLPNVTANVTDADVCAGDEVTFTGSNATSYMWSGSVTDNVPLSILTTATYTVTGTDGNGCSGTDSITVTVNSLPNVGATASSNPACDGDTVVFNGTNALSYTWTGGITDNIPVAVNATATYTVTGTDANGCSNTATLALTVNTLPTVTAHVNDSIVCTGDAVIFTGGNASTYSWSGGVTDNVAFNMISSGTYTVTGTDANGCSNTSSVSVTVNNVPAVNFTLTVDSVCTSYSPVALSGTPVGGTFTGTGVSGTTFNPSTGTGIYTITYTFTDGNGCTGTDADQLTVSGCLDIYNEVSNQVVVYPNPVVDRLYVKSSQNTWATVSICDMSGKQVLSTQVAGSEGMDVSQLSSGTYSVQLTMDGKIYHTLLIKK